MGIWHGWDLLQDEVRVTGTMVSHVYLAKDDGDWCFYLEPDNKGYLTTQLGLPEYTNASGKLECEVEPPDYIGGRVAEDEALVQEMLGPMLGHRVTVTGSWVRDRAHYADGSGTIPPAPFGDGDKGRYEIHPVFSLMREWDAGTGVRMVEVFAFSDDSANFPHVVPNSDQNRTVTFEVQARPDHELKILSEINQCLSREFRLELVNEGSGVSKVLKGTIQTGRASEGHGFYRGVLQLTPKAVAPPPKPDGVDVGKTPKPEVQWDEPLPGDELAPPAASQPAVAMSGDVSNYDVFAVGRDTSLMWLPVRGGSPEGWRSLGEQVRGVTAVGDAGDEVTLVIWRDNHEYAHATLRRGELGEWTPLGEHFSSLPAVARVPNGLLVVGRRGRSQSYQATIASSRGTAEWVDLGGNFTSSPAACALGDAVSVFGRGSNGSMWGRTLTRLEPADGWKNLLGQFSSGPAADVENEAVTVYGTGTNGALWRARPGAPWEPLGGELASKPDVKAHSLGTRGGFVRVVARGHGGEVITGTLPIPPVLA